MTNHPFLLRFSSLVTLSALSPKSCSHVGILLAQIIFNCAYLVIAVIALDAILSGTEKPRLYRLCDLLTISHSSSYRYMFKSQTKHCELN